MSGTAFSEETLRAVFTRLDTSGDGFLSHGELLDGLLHSDLIRGNDSYDARQMLDRCWKLADADGNGQVSFREFWLLIGATRSPTETELKRAYAHFKAIDVSGDGVLDRLEVQEALANPDINWHALGVDRSVSDKQIYATLDEDGDSRVTFDEFWQFILASTASRERGLRDAAAAAASLSKFQHWTCFEVGDWLEKNGFAAYRLSFQANDVHGGKLNMLTFDSLPKLGVTQFDHCKALMREIRYLKGQEPGKMETTEDMLAKGRRFAAATAAARKAVARDVAETNDYAHGQTHSGGRSFRFGSKEAFKEEQERRNEMYAKPKIGMSEMV